MKRARIAALILITLGSVSASWPDWNATGRFEYTDRLYNASGFTGTLVRPVREADVQVYDTVSQVLLAQGVTNQTGDFSITVPDSQIRSVGVRVLSSTTQTPSLHFTVLDDTLIPEPVFLYHDQAKDVANHAPTDAVDFGVMTMPLAVGPFDSTDWSSQVFNIFDCAVMLCDWIADADGARPAVPFAIGFHPGQGRSGSSYSDFFDRIFLADTDGYCDTVINHEIGHYIEDNYGFSTNPGGPHFFGDDDQDLRLSWSEGFGSWVGCATLAFNGRERPDLYVDRNSFQTGAGAGFTIAIEPQVIGGAANELAVIAALYDLIDSASSADSTPGSDDDPLSDLQANCWSVVERFRVERPRACTVEEFWDNWFELGFGLQSDMITTFTTHQIELFPDAHEPNDTIEQATPFPDFINPLKGTFYRTGANAGGDEDWYSFNATAGNHYVIEVNIFANSLFGRPDPEMFLIDPVSGQVLAHSSDRFDAILNDQGFSDTQDQGETAPLINFEAPATQSFLVLLRHHSDALNLSHRYGTYFLAAHERPAQGPVTGRGAIQRMLPGQSYHLGLETQLSMTTVALQPSHPGITVAALNWRGEDMLEAVLSIAGDVPTGDYTLTPSNSGFSGPASQAFLRVDASTAQPPVVISEMYPGTPDLVEIVNVGTVPANLTGWTISTRSAFSTAVGVFTFPNFTLPPGATVLVNESPGTDTATELFDNAGTVNFPWVHDGGGDLWIADSSGNVADYWRWVRQIVETQNLPPAGVLWQQPEISSPVVGSLSRHLPSFNQWGRDGLSEAIPTVPLGLAGRENAVDDFEPNESIREASILRAPATLSGLEISPRLPEIDLPVDQDWFGILVKAGESIQVTAQFNHAAGNLDMELYAPGEEFVPLSTSTSTDNDEVLVLPVATAGGIHRVRVFGASPNATNDYTVLIEPRAVTVNREQIIQFLLGNANDPEGLDLNGGGVDASDLAAAVNLGI